MGSESSGPGHWKTANKNNWGKGARSIGGKLRVRCWKGFMATTTMFRYDHPPAPLRVGRRNQGTLGHSEGWGPHSYTVCNLPPAQPTAPYLLTRGSKARWPRRIHASIRMLGRRQEAEVPSFSDAFPQLFPRWDQGWLTPLPTSDPLRLRWAFTLRGRGQQGHVCASYICPSKMLDRVELPFQQTAPLLLGQRSLLWAQFLGGLSQGYVWLTEHQLLSCYTFKDNYFFIRWNESEFNL